MLEECCVGCLLTRNVAGITVRMARVLHILAVCEAGRYSMRKTHVCIGYQKETELAIRKRLNWRPKELAEV